MTTIIVIEPHPLLRLGILQLLSDGSCSCTLEGADYSLLTRETSTQRNCELILLSISSFESLHELAHAAERICSPKSILLLSDSSSMPHSVQGLPASVAGYVPKNAPPEVLQASVKLVLAGGSCFPMRAPDAGQQMSLPLVKNFEPVKWPPENERKNKVVNGSNPECEMLGLTPRQYEVLVLLARGYPMKTVGRYLNISVATAKAHTETLYQRLDVHNRNAAVYAAVSRGATLGWPSIQGASHDA
ncbi:response regulator transcription factor [Alcaligenaceae bacterium]|nr:response regulator transcription factor [Alcaligenaceae bacterium]